MEQTDLFRKRSRKPPPAPEFAIHCMVADTLTRWADREWRWSHFPAGEARTRQTGARLKRMGTQSGWPDLILVSPAGQFHGLELKRLDGSLIEAQLAFQVWCQDHRIPHAVAYNYEQAVKILQEWGILRRGIIV